MVPCAAFFGIFMAAILNLPDKPLAHKLMLLLIFMCIVMIEKIGDYRREDIRSFYPLFKGGICFIAFTALSLVYTSHILKHPLKLFGIVVGGVIFGMTIYMPIRFQDDDRQKERSGHLKDSVPNNRND